MTSTRFSALRKIPKVTDCIAALSGFGYLKNVPPKRIKYCIRLYLNQMRRALLAGQHVELPEKNYSHWFHQLAAFVQKYHQPNLSRIINATGVILHTNLGRALLPDSSLSVVNQMGGNYSNLELDLETGKRGSRYAHVQELLCELTGAEAALVVNNNAAAVLLALETLGSGKEVVVSRGQLVEIGGSFRIPDIMARSGARLVEVGTTNCTHLQDYKNAITDDTAVLLRVHCSNYKIIGFTNEVANSDLVQLAKAYNIVVMEDLGSGCFVDLSKYGLAKEPTVQETVAAGIDVVTFSGDKLLGGPQAGILVGKKVHIDQLKRNPLNRALRIDKLTLAALESVLRLYLDESQALKAIPTLAMIAAPESAIHDRAQQVCQQCRETMDDHCIVELVNTFSQVGGGAMPGQHLASWAVAVRPLKIKASRLERQLRHAPVPVIGRMEDDRLLLDMRTVSENEQDLLIHSLYSALTMQPDAYNHPQPSL
ncbi:L-seryl-tRNA(Sec) selenium transferase [Desulfobulbus propionicus DSM 2032]|uniref:L-seryl-tRNA(Sec) selenium transferase n=1 Tax=Desulfobulbus propionicus (strain ATCC 33891 / DSM 2032 / VKM B-1956 / 1pr3) TaxID=577650 RepID=A0A7U4DPV6_DESPD|nr:L-seryl-tRNA(Sec) selenium transferase [Desulfobulbus propionicus DSM 2032]